MKNIISIVIPTKDRAESLTKVLYSYLSQKLVREVIVVDDGSQDNTKKLIKEIQKSQKKLVYIRNKVNKGVPTAKNIGIKHAKGSFIFIGEDDVELEADHLIILMEHLKINKAQIAAGRIIYVNPGETVKYALARANLLIKPPVNKKLITVNYSTNLDNDTVQHISHALMLIDKNVFNKIKFDDTYKVNFWREETDFQLRAAKMGFKLIYCPHTISYHKTTRTSSGCRSTNKFVYEYWVFKNNFYFIKTHLQFIKEAFDINSIHDYFISFSAYRIRLHFSGFVNRVKVFRVIKLQSKGVILE